MSDKTRDIHMPGMEGRVAVVTGGIRGIGREIASMLRAQGASVVVLDVTQPEGGDRDGCRFLTCDISDERAVDHAFADVEQTEGPVSLLVNNAGILRRAMVVDLELEEWDRILAVNLTGTMLCCRRALPGMRDAGYGRIVCIGSSAGESGGYGCLAAYGASKAGLLGLAKWIAVEYAADGITCNAIAPAAIDTEMISDLNGFEENIPVRRLGTPRDVATAVAYLCSSAASYVTGEVLDVNGGYLID